MMVVNAIKKYFSSLLLILLAYPFFKTSFPTDCYFVSRCGLGDPSFLLMMLLLPVIAFVIFIIIIIAAYRLHKKLSVNSVPFYTIGLLIVAFFLIKLLYPDIIFGGKVLIAESRNSNVEIVITLRRKKHLEMRMFKGTRGMVHLSSYRIVKDTLYIDGDIDNDIKILGSKDDLISNKYIIDTIHQRLYPMQPYLLNDTATYLTIASKEQ